MKWFNFSAAWKALKKSIVILPKRIWNNPVLICVLTGTIFLFLSYGIHWLIFFCIIGPLEIKLLERRG
ncbi:hypothetical protein A2Y83_04560 [Candidatus Falkowbacteria bacterium RBG_13_39_14]|uniref:Uncharacterized protein n=1 Tax=Candidatus Falkowbacteria bacterium RBG_13_39_14 TaxID=1797985 RepID=A0A1F5S4A5_9BACT|nr:MAG: hypothetical protein A2Y83_04560 [Candidatus Falkowbacteria bacterium RBG_13_39_14]